METVIERPIVHTQQELLMLLRAQLPYLAQEYGVRRIGMFGSFARNQVNDHSDVDLVVEFSQPIGLRFVDLSDYLERILQRSVDLLTPSGIHSIRAPHLAADIQQSIIYV